MDFNSQLLNPRMKCALGMAEVGSRGSLHMQPGNSGLTSPKSHVECLPAAPRLPRLYVPAAVAGCRVAGPTSVPAAACSGGLGGGISSGNCACPISSGTTSGRRPPEATQTLACGPSPMPSPVNPSISSSLPHLGYRTSSGCHPPQKLQ